MEERRIVTNPSQIMAQPIIETKKHLVDRIIIPSLQTLTLQSSNNSPTTMRRKLLSPDMTNPSRIESALRRFDSRDSRNSSKGTEYSPSTKQNKNSSLVDKINDFVIVRNTFTGTFGAIATPNSQYHQFVPRNEVAQHQSLQLQTK